MKSGKTMVVEGIKKSSVAVVKGIYFIYLAPAWRVGVSTIKKTLTSKTTWACAALCAAVQIGKSLLDCFYYKRISVNEFLVDFAWISVDAVVSTCAGAIGAGIGAAAGALGAGIGVGIGTLLGGPLGGLIGGFLGGVFSAGTTSAIVGYFRSWSN